MYLEHISSLLHDYPRCTVSFKFKIGNADVFKKLLIEYDNVCLFDHDFNENEFENNLRTCLKLNVKRKKNDVTVDHAYSSICFDLWLVLHKEFISRPAVNTKEYVYDVRRLYNLPKGANIKGKDMMEKILAQITLNDVKTAIHNAERIRKGKPKGSENYVTGTDYYYKDPDFSIDIFLKKVHKKSGIDILT